MRAQSLNGLWEYRVGQGSYTTKQVPFSTLPVGQSTCRRTFDLEQTAPRVLLRFDGITYGATVSLNGVPVGEMVPYCEYTFDVTSLVRATDNLLEVCLEDIALPFGPTEGWENYGGIIRDVSLLYARENYITDVFFHAEVNPVTRSATFVVETTAFTGKGDFAIRLLAGDAPVVAYTQAAGQTVTMAVENLRLWSPEAPALYRLEVDLQEGDVVDTYGCDVGFRDIRCDRHRFIINGQPVFLKGVCKHEMIGDSGHCPTPEQIEEDMRQIKATGCNFVRLVHYPHNKKILEIADRIGLFVSEEPGLWWSDTDNPAVAAGSLEVLRRTILRDRNHPSIAFWLCFNECRFTEQFLVDSANLCRQYDPTRMVSGANCMSNEDTLVYYNKCGFDFYTMHPYWPTPERAKISATLLHDKPLLFTEWGGYHVYNNPHLLADFMEEFYSLYEANSDEGALAGAFFWCWAELNDYNRGAPACVDGNLSEGLVDCYRRPTLLYDTYCRQLAKMGQPAAALSWVDWAEDFSVNPDKMAVCEAVGGDFAAAVAAVMEGERPTAKMRKRILKHGPVLRDVPGLLSTPLVVGDGISLTFTADFSTECLTLVGMTTLAKGYPLGGAYGEAVATVTLSYEDGSERTVTLKNGEDVTTVFGLNFSSRINPVAENACRLATFGYDKNFEYYVLNGLPIATNSTASLRQVTVISANNGYDLLLYGISG